MRTLLYTRAGCAASARLRAELERAGESFTEVDLSREPAAEAELLKLTGGRRLTPVLVRSGRVEIPPDATSF